MNLPTGPGGASRTRRIRAARSLAWLLAVVAAVPMFGLIDLGTLLGLSNPSYVWSMSLEASWGSLFTFLIAGGFGWIGTAPRRPWPGLGLVGLAAGGLAIGGAIFLDPGPVAVAAALAVAGALLVMLLRPEPARRTLGWPVGGWPVGGWALGAAAGVPLWLGYAWHTFAASVPGSADGDVTMGIDHWPVQVGLGLALAAGSAVLALRNESLLLWRCAFALCAGFVAGATLIYPGRAGAMPHPAWGVGLALWGVILSADLIVRLTPSARAARSPVGS